MTTGITSTQTINAAEPEKCCTREGPHVHYVPRKPPVNAAGDVDVFDASNQPSMDIDQGTMEPGVAHDATEHIDIPDFIQEEEFAIPVEDQIAEEEVLVTETEEEEDAEVQE